MELISLTPCSHLLAYTCMLSSHLCPAYMCSASTDTLYACKHTLFVCLLPCSSLDRVLTIHTHTHVSIYPSHCRTSVHIHTYDPYTLSNTHTFKLICTYPCTYPYTLSNIHASISLRTYSYTCNLQQFMPPHTFHNTLTYALTYTTAFFTDTFTCA